MKLIDKKEVKEKAINYSTKVAKKANYFGLSSLQKFAETDFISGVKFAESRLRSMMIEFAEFIDNNYARSLNGKWRGSGMPTLDTTEQLLEQFLKQRDERAKDKDYNTAVDRLLSMEITQYIIPPPYYTRTDEKAKK